MMDKSVGFFNYALLGIAVVISFLLVIITQGTYLRLKEIISYASMNMFAFGVFYVVLGILLSIIFAIRKKRNNLNIALLLSGGILLVVGFTLCSSTFTLGATN